MNRLVATLLSVVVIGINTFFVVNTVNGLELEWPTLTLVVFFGILYLLFCLYLTIHMAISMGNESLLRFNWVTKYVMGGTANNDTGYTR